MKIRYLVIICSIICLGGVDASQAQELSEFGLDDVAVTIDKNQQVASEKAAEVKAKVEETAEQVKADLVNNAEKIKNEEKVLEEKAQERIDNSEKQVAEAVVEAEAEIKETTQEVNESLQEAVEEIKEVKNVDENSEIPPVVTESETKVEPESVQVIEETAAEVSSANDAAVTEKTEIVAESVATEEVKSETPQNSAPSGIKGYIEQLNLTEDQFLKAKEINDRSRQRLDEILREVKDLRQEALEIEAKSLADFKAILNENQQELFVKIQQEYEKSKNLAQ